MVSRPRSAGASGGRLEWPYSLRGGALCLEFANTLGWWGRPGVEDRLRDYPALLAWGVRAGASEPADARRLLAAAARRPAVAQRTLRAARRLRAAIHAVFTATAAGGTASRGDLEVLNEALAQALDHLRLELRGSRRGAGPRGSRLAWAWVPDDSLERVLWPVVRSAAELLTSPDLARVRACGDPECGWLFLDTSRNRTRRWCSMSDCGNRAKVRRHYRRHLQT